MSTYLATLSSYLPALLRQQLAQQPAPLIAPRLTTFPAVLLFADITGFTSLTLRLAQKGAEGVEELSRLLDDYFDQLITLINAHGGDIFKIAGDGVLVIWPSAPAPLGQTLLRAAQCALAIQAKLHNYQTFEGTPLAMRIGVACGPLTLVQVGGIFGRWEALATGAPILQACIAEARCQPGQVILTPEAYALAPDALEIELVRHAGQQALRLLAIPQPLPPRPLPWLPLTPEAETAARAYIPGAILQRLAAGQASFLAELRRLTVVFVNLPDFEKLEPLEAVQTLMQTLQKALYRYEGSINQLLMDDKGTTLVAALGLPPLAHGDDPTRGLLAALEVAAGLRTLNQRYAIGVTTGAVYCGERGNALRREYTLLGDAVNTAARLMQAVRKTGQSDVFCDAATWQAAQNRVAFAILPPINVRGRTEPLAIYRPLHEKELPAQLQADLVGRLPEKNLLQEAMQLLLRSERQGPIILEGEAGLGKSRLVEEAQRQATRLGLAFFSGQGDAIERTTAYHAWRNVIRTGFGLHPDLSLAEQRAKVVAHLPEPWQAYAPLLDVVLLLDTPATEATAALDAQTRRDKTHDLLVLVLQGICAPSFTVLVLEDAHWFDTASWSLVAIAGRLAQQWPLLVVVTTRPLTDTYPPEYIQLREQPGAQGITLQPLDETNIAALIAQRLQVAQVGVTLQAFIQQRAEGNPFFALETLASLREADLLLQTAHSCDLKSAVTPETLVLPETVQGLILSRFDRLPLAEQMTLKVASVLGRVFSAAAVQAVALSFLAPGALEDHWLTLQARDFIVATGNGWYAFKHALIQDAVYHQMLFAQRRTLHRAVAEWVETTQAQDLAAHYARLAYHYWRALGQPQDDPALTAKLLDYLEKAGTQASARLTYLEAVEFFTQALTLADKLPPTLTHLVPTLRRMQWWLKRGKAHFDLGQLAEGHAALELVAQLGGHPLPLRSLALYWGIAHEVGRQAWHRLRPLAFSRSLGREPASSAALVAEALTWLFQSFILRNRITWAIFSAFKGVNLVESLPTPPPFAAMLYSELRFLCGVVRLAGLEKCYAQLTQKSAGQTAEPTLRSGPIVLGLISLLGQGEWQPVKTAAAQALAHLERYAPAHRIRGVFLALETYVAYFQGDFAHTAPHHALIGQVGRMGNSRQFQIWEFLGIALRHYALGQFDLMPKDIEIVERFLAEDSGVEFEYLHLYTSKTWLALAQQDWAKAEIHAAQIKKTFIQSPVPLYYTLYGKTACAEVPLILWRRANKATAPAQVQRWRAAAHRACRALGWFARLYRIGQPAAQRCWGYYHWLCGHTTKALRHWQASLHAAEQLAMKHDIAQAHWALAHLPTSEAQAHRQQAKEILEALGAGLYFEYLEKLG